MYTLNDERKQNLKDALFQKGATKKFLADIDDIQELIFLIASLNKCPDKNVGFNIDDSRELIFKHFLSKIANLSEYFLICDKSTGGLLINQNYADLFSCKEIADAAEKNYTSIGVQCSVISTNSLGIDNIFEYLYFLGIKYLMIDRSPTSYCIAVNRNDILSKSQIKKNNNYGCSIDNPELRFAISNFYCSLRYKNAFGIDDRRLTNLQNIMTYETANAKYLLPVKSKDDKEKFSAAKVTIQNHGEMLPVFTDKIEFNKVFPKGWDYMTLDFENVSRSAVTGNCNGIVINLASERLSIDRHTIEHIKKTAANMIIK